MVKECWNCKYFENFADATEAVCWLHEKGVMRDECCDRYKEKEELIYGEAEGE